MAENGGLPGRGREGYNAVETTMMETGPKNPLIAAKRDDLRETALRFADRELRGRLGWGETPLEAQSPDSGNNSLLFFIGPRGGERVVLRVFDKTKQWNRHVRALKLAEGSDAPTPRIIHKGSPWLDRLRYGKRFLTTEFAAGKTLDAQPATREMRRGVARSLARLHRAESPVWGRPGSKPRTVYADDLKRGVERRIEELGSRPSDLTAERIEAICKGMLSLLEGLRGVSVFHLCHHHLGMDDILYDAETDAATLVDCMNLQFSRAWRDLSEIRPQSWLADPADWRDFIETYYAHSPESRREEEEREAPFFETFRMLSLARNAVLRAPGKGAVSLARVTARKHLEPLWELGDSNRK